MGRIQYKDYEKEVFATCDRRSPFFYKRRCFAFEKEVRVLVNPAMDRTGIENALIQTGLEIPLDVDRLLTEIHVSPACRSWFLETVTRAVRALGISCPVSKALMDSEPAF